MPAIQTLISHDVPVWCHLGATPHLQNKLKYQREATAMPLSHLSSFLGIILMELKQLTSFAMKRPSGDPCSFHWVYTRCFSKHKDDLATCVLKPTEKHVPCLWPVMIFSAQTAQEDSQGALRTLSWAPRTLSWELSPFPSLRLEFTFLVSSVCSRERTWGLRTVSDSISNHLSPQEWSTGPKTAALLEACWESVLRASASSMGPGDRLRSLQWKSSICLASKNCCKLF